MVDHPPFQENHSRFEDLCNAEFVDKTARAAAEALFAADQNNPMFTPPNNLIPVPVINQTETKFLEPTELVPETNFPIAETVNQVYFPTRGEREAFGNRLTRSPQRDVSVHSNRSNCSNHSNHTTHSHRSNRSHHSKDPTIPNPTVPISNPNETTDRWESQSMYEEEQQEAKVCYLIKIEELRGEGVQMYKEVDINSDLPTIKLCHSFMRERANRRDMLNGGKGLVKFGADLLGKATDFFQKNTGDDDSSEWRKHFRETIDSGLHDKQIRKVVNKYEHLQVPEELALAQIIWNSKQRFDEQRKKERKAKEEAKLQEHSDTLESFETYLKQKL